jgi:hypothetical protein
MIGKQVLLTGELSQAPALSLWGLSGGALTFLI